jgi:hypothetical protein
MLYFPHYLLPFSEWGGISLKNRLQGILSQIRLSQGYGGTSGEADGRNRHV